MKHYETKLAQVEGKAPRQLQDKTAMEIVAYLCKHFKIDSKCRAQNQATAYMQAVAKAIFDPSYWKNPIYAELPSCGKEWAKAAIIWYHGAEPVESSYGVWSSGYACW